MKKPHWWYQFKKLTLDKKATALGLPVALLTLLVAALVGLANWRPREKKLQGNTPAALTKNDVTSQENVRGDNFSNSISNSPNAQQNVTINQRDPRMDVLLQQAYENDLRKRYSYGYYLFIGSGEEGKWTPHLVDNITVDAIWSKFTLSLDPKNKRFRFVGSDTVVLRNGKPIMSIGELDFKDAYELRRPLGPSLMVVDGKSNFNVEIVDDDPNRPIWVIGFGYNVER